MLAPVTSDQPNSHQVTNYTSVQLMLQSSSQLVVKKIEQRINNPQDYESITGPHSWQQAIHLKCSTNSSL